LRALITGITGFAGNYLAQLLLKESVEVHGMANDPLFEPFLDLGARSICYFPTDICDLAGVRNLLSEIKPDWVFHLAARTSPSKSLEEPLETFNVNWGGTLNLLEAIRTLKLPCRFLLVSSGQIYGRSQTGGHTLAEVAPLHPATPYAVSKAASELLASQYAYAYGVLVVRVRPFNHTGPGQGEGFVCPDMARKVAEIECGLRPPSLQVRNPDALLDLTDVRDIVEGYVAAIQKGLRGEVYNLCSGRGIPVSFVARHLASLSKRGFSLEDSLAGSAAGEEGALIGDNSRAERELGWRPRYPVEQTLREVLDYWRGIMASQIT